MQSEQEKQQQDYLGEINNYADNILTAANAISVKIKRADVAEGKMEKEMSESLNKMNFINKKLGVLLNTSNSSSICTVLALIGLFMLMLCLVLFT